MFKNVVLVFLSAVLFYLSSPKADVYLLAWIAFVPLLYVLYKAEKIKWSFFYGYIFGIFFFSFIYFWINDLNQYVGMIANLGWILQAICQGLYFGLLGILFFYVKKEKNFWLKIFAIPSIFIIIEYLVSLIPFGVVINIGYSQRLWTGLIQLCSITGVLGITFLIILFNNLIALIIFNKDANKKQKLYSIGVFVLILAVVLIYGNQRLNSKLDNTKKLRIAIIQPNFSIEEKIIIRNYKYMKDQCFAMTKSALDYKPDIIIWPETAILPILMHENVVFKEEIKKLLKESNSVFISGTWRRIGMKEEFYNSSVIIENGQVLGWQDKTNLIPFGEYLPFRSILIKIPIFGKSPFFSYDLFAEKEIKVIKTSKSNLGILICVDSVFSDTVKQFIKKGADLIITITNDSWFRKNTALYQHMLVGFFRAVENKVYFIQVANTGISGVIDPFGRPLRISDVNTGQVILSDIYLTKPKTIFLAIGYYYLIIPIMLLLFCLIRNYKTRHLNTWVTPEKQLL